MGIRLAQDGRIAEQPSDPPPHQALLVGRGSVQAHVCVAEGEGCPANCADADREAPGDRPHDGPLNTFPEELGHGFLHCLGFTLWSPFGREVGELSIAWSAVTPRETNRGPKVTQQVTIDPQFEQHTRLETDRVSDQPRSEGR